MKPPLKIKLDKEFKGNVWDLVGLVNLICIPTNGWYDKRQVTKLTEKVSREADKKFPGLKKDIGFTVSTFGNFAHFIKVIYPKNLVSHNIDQYTRLAIFPTRSQYVKCNKKKINIIISKRDEYEKDDRVPGYYASPSLKLIEESSKFLLGQVECLKLKKVVIVKPEDIDWEDVKEVFKEVGIYNHPSFYFIKHRGE
ncbi:MAG: hypothetical protein RBR32_06670 [Bacteroidales bacterium]|nr:hypothetical protein [Bacteroidales bacterium]